MPVSTLAGLGSPETMSADFPVEVGKLKFVKKLSVTTLPHRVHDTVPEPRDNVISSTPVAWDTESYTIAIHITSKLWAVQVPVVTM